MYDRRRRQPSPQMFSNAILVLMVGCGIFGGDIMDVEVRAERGRRKSGVIVHDESADRTRGNELCTPVVESASNRGGGAIRKGKHPGIVGVRIDNAEKASNASAIRDGRDFHIHINEG